LRARDAAIDDGFGSAGAAEGSLSRAPAAFDSSAPSNGAVHDSAGAPASMLGPGGFFSSLTYVGQLQLTYLVCESDGELILIDQHAAHERVAFERLRIAQARGEVRRQRLLFAVPVEVDDVLAAAAADGDLMQALGFELDAGGARPGSAGKTTLLVKAVPELLKDAGPGPLLRDVLGQLADGGPATSAAEHIDHALATMACHSVVRAGDVLGRPQVVALLNQLDSVDLRSHCPHGRPVLLRLPMSEIERRFGRI
jgi:DNA mismatch repair protein MutL